MGEVGSLHTWTQDSDWNSALVGVLHVKLLMRLSRGRHIVEGKVVSKLRSLNICDLAKSRIDLYCH
jgi:hypothetical protein